MSPYGLCSFLPTISDEQKRDITELGFVFLLTLRVDKIPSRLARWLVQNFDTCRRAVKLASNEEFRISEEDVYLTMGFPRGSKPVQEAKKSDKGEYTRVLDEEKAQWAVDLKEVKDLNWCEFTIDSLISCTDKWKRQPKVAYRGPLLFLMLCYVDRVLCKKRMIGREFPILANWTSKDLWARMNFELESCQGFGKGIEDDRIKASDTLTLYIQEEEADIRAKKVLLILNVSFSEPCCLY
ncbi:hypothetical protein Cgig2_009510 [Carnegiea gigantea]|uniref:Uncharacterized protein n=1 Tax=Carnegiea gigantea TaxID=171969 RepID=A0A9Q1JHW0_9CARY|nr:hypothetical protein Cgig2_009510 [Carnegiea gigantea]